MHRKRRYRVQQSYQNKPYSLHEVQYQYLIHHLQYFSFDYFSPCSGLVVSGFSKRTKGKRIEELEKYLHQAISPYENFKKMFVVDNTTTEFKGKKKYLKLQNGRVKK